MELTDLIEILERNSLAIGASKYSPALLLWIGFLLLIIYLIRLKFFLKINSRAKSGKKYWILILHQFTCYLVSFVSSVLCISLFANPNNNTLNYIVCPILGFIISLFFDTYIMSKIDEEYGMNLNTQPDISRHNSTKKESLEDYTKLTNSDFISEDDIESDDHNLIIKDRINQLIKGQYVEAVEIKRVHSELTNISLVIDSLRETMKDDKKIKLEKEIYECLNKGFATPEENKIITTNYQNYRLLKGNGEIEELYTNHYIKLPIHEDRRRQ